jgi:hypothetical protein
MSITGSPSIDIPSNSLKMIGNTCAAVANAKPEHRRNASGERQ